MPSILLLQQLIIIRMYLKRDIESSYPVEKLQKPNLLQKAKSDP